MSDLNPSGQPGLSIETDWQVLAKLFIGERADFRHRMGLSKSDTHAFYAPTARHVSIRAQKEEILQSSDADQYLVETHEGVAAFREFAHLLGVPRDTPDDEPDQRGLNRAAALYLEPDWLLLSPPDWRLAWASVCFPTRWSLVGKARHPLLEIHSVVPGLNEELGRKIDVFFGRLESGEGWARANWGLSSNGERNQHPSRPYTPLSDRTPGAAVYVRVESQHLLKLSGTGAIAFGIRILNFPLTEVMHHPDIAAGLQRQLRTMPIEVAAYKGIPTDFWQRL